MLACLKLEAIGDDASDFITASRGLLNTASEGLGDKFFGREKTYFGPWVARIGYDEYDGIARTFMRGDKDYSNANSKGSRGVVLVYFLSEGVYDVYERVSWKRSRRYYCRSVGGKIVEISEEEAVEWANAQSE